MTLATESWEALRTPPPLPTGPIAHVWRVPAEEDPEAGLTAGLEGRLTPEERQRAARFRFAEDRQAYVISHAALNEILAAYVGAEPEDLRYVQNAHGKPALTSPHQDVRFNLSHTRGMSLIAVSRGREVGVDIERMRGDAPVAQIAPRYFSDEEWDALQGLPEPERLGAFHEIWTRKEACLKAVGTGLAGGLGDFDVAVGPAAPSLLRASRRSLGPPEGWWLQDLHVGPGYAAAVACAREPGEEVQIRRFHFLMPGLGRS